MIKTSDEQASQLALKQRLLERAKALSNSAEVSRCVQVTLLICETVFFGVRGEAEIFQAAYGDPRGRKYWDAHLSEAIPVYSLAQVLSAHLAEKVEQLEMTRIAIIRAFLDAAEAGERWFTGDTSLLLATGYGQTNFENLGKLKVHPRAAVEWLLSKPKREHLVPDSLRRVLQSSGEATCAKATTKTQPLTEKKAERPNPDVTDMLCGTREEQDERACAASKAQSHPGAKSRGVAEAIEKLWPDGLPKGLSAKDRNRAIITWLKDAGYSLPTNTERMIQRVLKVLPMTRQ
jgi:hypothetical protein